MLKVPILPSPSDLVLAMQSTVPQPWVACAVREHLYYHNCLFALLFPGCLAT